MSKYLFIFLLSFTAQLAANGTPLDTELLKIKRAIARLETRVEVVEADVLMLIEASENLVTSQEFRSLRRWVKSIQDELDTLQKGPGYSKGKVECQPKW